MLYLLQSITPSHPLWRVRRTLRRKSNEETGSSFHHLLKACRTNNSSLCVFVGCAAVQSSRRTCWWRRGSSSIRPFPETLKKIRNQQIQFEAPLPLGRARPTWEERGQSSETSGQRRLVANLHFFHVSCFSCRYLGFLFASCLLKDEEHVKVARGTRNDQER
jgi:hypothetical protein